MMGGRYMKKLAILLFLASALSFAKLAPAFSERTYYADEIVLKRKSVVFGDEGILKTKWGTLLADNVTWFVTEDSWTGDSRSRLAYIMVDGEIREVPRYAAKGYKHADAVKYPYRIEQAMNLRQQAEICKASNNNLKLLYPSARATVGVLIQNLHSEYPYIRVMNTTTGWSFEKP